MKTIIKGETKYVVETAWQDKEMNWDFVETGEFDTLTEARGFAKDAHREDRRKVTSVITKRTVLEEIVEQQYL